MTLPQFLLAFLVLSAPPLYWMWWLYSKSHPEGRWRRLFGATAIIGVGIALFWGGLYVLDRLFPRAGVLSSVLTQKAPVIIIVIPVIVALALVFACILMAWVARMTRHPQP